MKSEYTVCSVTAVILLLVDWSWTKTEAPLLDGLQFGQLHSKSQTKVLCLNAEEENILPSF